jgi:membrane protease YdiL (CAAX protease family)
MLDTTNADAPAYSYKPVQFFLVTYALTWVPWGIAAYFSYQEGMEVYRQVFFFLGGLGPTLSVLFFVLGSKSPDLKRDFFDRLTNLRRSRPWYFLIAALLFPALAVFSVFVSTVFGQSLDQLAVVGDFILWLPLLFLAPLFEEPGWRGYGVESLRSKFGVFASTLMLAVLWSLWHWPLPFIKGTYQYDVAHTQPIYILNLLVDQRMYVLNFFLGMIPLTFIFNWVYYRSSRSILAIILIHVSLNAPPEMLSIAKVTKLLETPINTVFAILVVAFNWRLFMEGPKDFLSNGLANAQQRTSGEEHAGVLG